MQSSPNGDSHHSPSLFFASQQIELSYDVTKSWAIVAHSVEGVTNNRDLLLLRFNVKSTVRFFVTGYIPSVRTSNHIPSAFAAILI